MNTLDFARQYLSLGFSVVPCVPRGKRPAVPWQEYQTRKPSDAELVQWFGNGQESSNIGVVCGSGSGVIVLDVDAGGEASLTGKELPPTPCVTTGGRGWHYYFRHPGGTVRNFARKLPGLDLRGDGGLVVAPPSVHPSGAVYEWAVPLDAVPLADAPAWLLALLDKPRLTDAKPGGWLTESLAGVSEGQRNDAAIRLAGRFRRAGLSSNETLAILRLWNDRNKPPLPDAELCQVSASASKMDGPERTVQLFTLGQLREVTSSVLWEWRDWIPKGAVTTLVSKPGVGKTLLSCALTCGKVRGGVWPDNTPATPGRVLYLDAEAGAGELSEKFCYVGLSGEHRDLALAYGERGGFLCADVDWQGIEDAWLSFGPELVFVDPLTGHHRRDASSGPAMRSFYARLMDLAQQTGAAVVVLHHLRKRGLFDGEEIDLDRVRDSSDITAASRSVLALQEMESGDLKLSSLKSNFASKPEPLRIRKGADGLLYVGQIEDAEQKTVVEQAAAWLAVLLGGGPKKARDVETLAAEKGITARALRRGKVRAGIVSTKGQDGWTWSLPGDCGQHEGE
jgi:hypothetical protein